MGIFDLFKGKKEEIKTTSAINVNSGEYKINLLKERKEIIKVNLEKTPAKDTKARVALVLDVSGSMRNMFRSGLIQAVIERLYPIASTFDDDEELDVIIFSNKCSKKESVTFKNFQSYVEDFILNSRDSILWGGTNYAPAINEIIKTYKNSTLPAYIIYIADGGNDDKENTIKAIVEASQYPIFFQFVGLDYDDFSFLKKLDTNIPDRVIDNANFFQIENIANTSDEKLYSLL